MSAGVLLGSPATGSTFNIWYVSEVARVTKGTPVNAGYVTIDRDVLWSQPASFTISAWDQPDLMEQLVRGVGFSFYNDPYGEWRPVPERLSFEEGKLVSWSFATWGDRIDHYYGVSSRGDVSVYTFPYYGYDPHEAVYDPALRALGYTQGTPEYNDLACGSWVPGYGSDNCNDGLWYYEFFTDRPGTWTEDFSLFADLLGERFMDAGSANPPYSWRDIPPAPIPLPPAALLLLGGIAALAATRAQRTRVPKRS